MDKNVKLDRRAVLTHIGSFLAFVPLAKVLSACSGDTTTSASASDAGVASGDAASAADGSATADASAWASGGTASMTAQATYPNPFTTLPTSCTPTGTLTEGPCYDSDAITIQDISYGQPGLPVRLMFQVLDANCQPVANATVSVWHCDPLGIYSGNDSAHEDVSFCTGNKSEYENALYFRGIQTTDANGVVAFDTCFPGWYSSRTIHIHFTVTSGSTTFTSQYVFEDALDDEIISTQPVYDTRPKRDTSNTTDTVVSASTYENFLFKTQQMTDGAMLAWGSITLS